MQWNVASQVNKQFRCQLLRCKESGEWIAYTRPVMTYITASEVIIRDALSNALLCDLPKEAILNSEVISANILRLLTTGQTRFALQFEDSEALNMATSSLYHIGVQVDRHLIPDNRQECPLPNLEDPAVQEYILRLLFDDEFSVFVSSVKSLIHQFQSTIGQYVGSDASDDTAPQDMDDQTSANTGV